MAATVRSPGASIAPISSTLAHSHTRSLKTASNWRNTCIILFGKVSISSCSFVSILKEAYSAFPFLSSDWIKSTSEQRRKIMFEKIYESLTEPRDIPNDLQVPPGNVLLLRAYGRGVQIYT